MKIRRGMLVLIFGLLPDLVAAQHTGSEAGDAYALVIGVGAYPHFPLGDRLRYAGRDAEAFRDFLRSPPGGEFAEERIRFLTEERATRVNIFREIRWLEQRVRANDRLYVFFTGHGLVHDDGRAYLMPYDSDPDDPTAIGIRADLFVSDIRTRIEANRLLFFIDACHSAAALNPGGTARGQQNVVPALRDVWLSETNQSDVALGFFSASANQRSWEDQDLRHGVFTHFLLQGLRGAADGRPDGVYDQVVTAGELRSYLLDAVSMHSRRRFQTQEPAFSPVFDGSIALATTPARIESAVEQPASVPPVPPNPLLPETWRPAPPGTFPLAQTRAYLTSLGTVIIQDDFEPSQGQRNGYESDSSYMYFAGGRMHIDTRFRSTHSVGFHFAGTTPLENYVFQTTVSVLSADTATPAGFYIGLQTDSTTYYYVLGYARGGSSQSGIYLYRMENSQRIPDLQCSAKMKPLWSSANVLIKDHHGRLQVWFDDTLCFDFVRDWGRRGLFVLGASGYAEVAYDDLFLIQLQ